MSTLCGHSAWLLTPKDGQLAEYDGLVLLIGGLAGWEGDDFDMAEQRIIAAGDWERPTFLGRNLSEGNAEFIAAETLKKTNRPANTVRQRPFTPHIG